MGFTISSHDCGGKRVKTVLNIGHADVGCGMAENPKNCSDEEEMASDCCKNGFQNIQIEDDYTSQVSAIDFSTDFVVAFVATYFNLFQTIETEQDLFVNCSPPPLIKDIPVLVQAFLL